MQYQDKKVGKKIKIKKLQMYQRFQERQGILWYITIISCPFLPSLYAQANSIACIENNSIEHTLASQWDPISVIVD